MLKEHECRVARAGSFDGLGQEVSRSLEVTRVIRRNPSMQEFLALALPLRQCTSGAIDIRASPAMLAFEEGDTRPYIDGLFVMTSEVLIEPGEQQLLDARLTIDRISLARRSRVGGRAQRFGHPG